MAATKEIIISNGDTPEWIKLEFEAWTDTGKILKSFIDVAIGKTARSFDFQRKCWFVQKDVIEALLAGLNTLISQGTLSGYYITDKRIAIESFDEFFNKESQGYQTTPPKSKLALLKEMEHILKAHANIMLSIREDCDIVSLKPSYRKAAMVLHPDRNNGDGSKMSELNKVWAELQTYL